LAFLASVSRYSLRSPVADVVDFDGDAECGMGHIDDSGPCPVLDYPPITECRTEILRSERRPEIGADGGGSFVPSRMVSPSTAQRPSHPPPIRGVLPSRLQLA
jgi:hypothetical protein